ncbi:MAG: trans-sulfuration enzyme family protein [Thermoanaerobaculia bacterium]
MRIETLAVHAAYSVDPATGAVAPPIHLSTTFGRDESGAPLAGHTYVRESNPTQDLLEEALARLDGGEAALVFGSGMAAGLALAESLPPGSHLVLPEDVYYGYRVAVRDFFPRWGLTATFAPLEGPGALEEALRPETRLVWLESPSNPLLRVTDLAASAAVAKQAGALVLVDGTFATPILQRPIEYGADVVLHATTKGMGGHSDVQGGVLVFARKGELLERVRHVRTVLGAVSSPFNSWLVLRGLRTLAVRARVQSESALAVARALEEHPAVSKVNYPGLASHPGHEVARRQMSAFGSMISFHVAAGREAAVAAVGKARLFTRATSLGGVESLIEHRATSEGEASTAPPDLVRLSIGLEHPDDLVADLGRALGV